MRIALLLAGLMLITQLAAQTPPSCPADQPVDDLLTTIHKLHSKRANRTKTLLADSFCIGGWCLAARDRPKTFPEEIQITPPATDAEADPQKRVQIRQCEDALNDALHAAHNVEVGDQEFDQKNFRGALGRYEEALGQKSKDAAIEVRYARTAERLGNFEDARKHYKAALALGTPAKWSDEAKLSLQRLEAHP